MEIDREMMKKFVIGASMLANLVLIGFLIFGMFHTRFDSSQVPLIFLLLFLFPIANLFALFFESKKADANTSKMSASMRELIEWFKSIFAKPLVQKFCFYSAIILFTSLCIYSIIPKWQTLKEGNRVVSINKFTGTTFDREAELRQANNRGYDSGYENGKRESKEETADLKKQIADLKRPVDVDSALYISEIDDLKKQIANLKNQNADLNLTNHSENEHKK